MQYSGWRSFSMAGWRAFLAEGVGTFGLVLVGAGALAVNDYSQGGIGIAGVALAHGFALMALTYVTAHLSGAHLNPAVTVAKWVSGLMPGGTAVYYIIAQLVGASVAGAALWLSLPSSPFTATLGAPVLAEGVGFLQAILAEALFTFLLVFTVWGVVVDKRGWTPLSGFAIGLSLAVGVMVLSPLTGGALNPARAFGPMLVSGRWADHLVYWAGPVLGAVVAALVYDAAFLKQPGGKKKK